MVKKILKYSWIFIVHFLAAQMIANYYYDAQEPNRLPEPDHSFFTAECVSFGGTLEQCSCVENILAVLDEVDRPRALGVAAKDCGMLPE